MTRPRGIRPFFARWTPERDAELRRLAAIRPALTAEQIARRMSATSRNAVISRCRRSGVALGNAKGWDSRAARAAAKKRRGAQPRNKNGAAWTKAAKVAARNTPPSLPPVPSCTPRVAIKDISPRHCRFIGDRPALLRLDTPIYCGAPTIPGSSWCPEHERVVFNARVPPRFIREAQERAQ